MIPPNRPPANRPPTPPLPPTRDPFDSSVDIMKTVLEEVRAHRVETRTTIGTLQSDVARITSELIRLNGQQDRLASSQEDLKGRTFAIERQVEQNWEKFEAHRDDDAKWQAKQEEETRVALRLLGSIMPLAKSHEEILQQAKGAMQASKLWWAGLAVGAGIIGTVVGWAISLLK